MNDPDDLNLPVLPPNMQISFYFKLQAIRDLYFQEAMSKTVKKLDLSVLDGQLSEYVSPDSLKRTASFGLRGEIFFPVPSMIEKNPFLLGYYRLLLGLSQKEFYNKGPLGRFKGLEERGEISLNVKKHIHALCVSLVRTAEILVDGIDDLSLSIVHELQLLTLGPQLRGSSNTGIGQDATKEFFELFKGLIAPYIKETTKHTIHIENDSKRNVLIEFASDPDVQITEQLQTMVRPLVSIEIKGGRDASNIHNRVGEAEKSHRKARNRGFFEFWTMIRVNVDPAIIQRESPTTSHFFHLDRIRDPSTKEYKEFRDRLGSLMGIRIPD
ncbi:MAG: XcyI family restriction endonuclease [Syntrophobacteraceae bacterium]